MPPVAKPKTLDRVLSRAGAGSRTDAREWIAAGRVRVDSVVVRDPERWVDVARERVTLDGRPIRPARKIYLALYKPRGVLTTRRDPKGRKTVFDLLPAGTGHLFSVGRLDLDTSGLLLLTNDSELAERLTHPDFHVPKTYLVKAAPRLPDEALDALAAGIGLDDGPTRPSRVRRLKDTPSKTTFEITITEGRNRQVRRMVEAVGGTVLKLVRVSIGPLRLGDGPVGSVRPLEEGEVRSLRRAARERGPGSSPAPDSGSEGSSGGRRRSPSRRRR